MTVRTETHETTFSVRRLTTPVEAFETFQNHYEHAVPDVPRDAVGQLVAGSAPWSAMEDLLAAVAPHGFLIYFRNELHPVMASAGHAVRCTAYLMGNHVIAEKMFRHDPKAMLYAPLRTLIWEDAAGDAWFTVDQPSTVFGSLGIPAVRAVGEQLDRKLAQLLEALEVPVPPKLLHAAAP